MEKTIQDGMPPTREEDRAIAVEMSRIALKWGGWGIAAVGGLKKLSEAAMLNIPDFYFPWHASTAVWFGFFLVACSKMESKR